MMQKILVTGGHGFLGSHVLEAFRRFGFDGVAAVGRGEYDLTREDQVDRMFRDLRPEVVVHLAALCGGIGANRAHPGTFYYKNLMMGALTMEYARLHGVRKFVAVGTVCAYPKLAPVPFREVDLWNGYPEETNAPYGLAKKGMLVQAQAYRQEFGFNAIYLLPVNLYGPGDNFDPSSSHVIPALIRKFLDAVDSGAGDVECWGTGAATREFLYAADAAEAIVKATAGYDDPAPMNIGTGTEISIRDLSETIARLAGFTGQIVWNSSYPDGQPRRRLDCTRIKEWLGWEATTSLEDGLRAAIEWYRERRDALLPALSAGAPPF